jgi:hypothetical protein
MRKCDEKGRSWNWRSLKVVTLCFDMFCAYIYQLLFLDKVELRYKIHLLIKHFFMMDPEKARLQAEAKAAEDARMRAEVEAAAEIRRKRELEREAARQALLQASEHIIYCMCIQHCSSLVLS